MLSYLTQDQALSQALRSRMLGRRHSGFSVHNQVRVSEQDAEGRKKTSYSSSSAFEHGVRATVLEANRLGWGCSGRNGGQSQNAGGRLTRGQWMARWGLDTARRVHEECTSAYRTLDALIREHDIACDPQRGGHLYIAHRNASWKRATGSLLR